MLLNKFFKFYILQTTRGSFLSRNEELLSKLAKVTSAVTDNVRGPKNSKNFVFATKSPEKPKIAKKVSCVTVKFNFQNYFHNYWVLLINTNRRPNH